MSSDRRESARRQGCQQRSDRTSVGGFMGLLRRKKSTSPDVASRLPTSTSNQGRQSEAAEVTEIEELRAAAATAAAAAERAGTLAEDAQRQALLATETARSLAQSAPAPTATDQLAALSAEVDKLASLVRASIDESREARELVASLDTRITQLGTEIAHQIDELSGDVDALSAREPGDGPSAEVVSDLKSGQVRLAQEQARYQIAFRDDLAALADEVRKRPSR